MCRLPEIQGEIEGGEGGLVMHDVRGGKRKRNICGSIFRAKNVNSLI